MNRPTMFRQQLVDLTGGAPLNTKDMVTEEMNDGNKNEGDQTMHQPKDLKSLDNILPEQFNNLPPGPDAGPAAPGAPAPAPAATPAAASTERVVVSEAVLTSIDAKVKAGTELNADEKQILEDMKAGAEQPGQTEAEKAAAAAAKAEKEKIAAAVGQIDTTKVFKIGKNAYTFAEIEARARQEGHIGNVDLSQEGRKFLVETYVKAQNRTEQSIALDQRSKETAEQRKVNEAQLAQIRSERGRQEEFGRQLATEIRQFTERRTALQGVAGQGLTKESFLDTEGRVFDLDKQMAWMDQERAKRDLQSMEVQSKDLNSQVESHQAHLHVTVMNQFQAEHPEYQTSKPLTELATAIRKGEVVDKNDRRKLFEIVEFYDIANEKGWTIEDVWDLRTTQQHVAFRPGVQTPGEESELPQLPKPNQDILKTIADYRARQARAAGGPSGGPGGPAPFSIAATTPGRQIIESDRAYTGDNRDDPFLRETLKY